MPKIKTYIGNLKHCNTQGAKVLIIVRKLKPNLATALKNEYSAIQVEDLSPSYSLLQDWKGGRISWEDYVIDFMYQMTHNIRSVRCIRRIIELLNQNIDVYLVCYEDLSKPNEHCHRICLSNLIQSMGYVCMEV